MKMNTLKRFSFKRNLLAFSIISMVSVALVFAADTPPTTPTAQAGQAIVVAGKLTAALPNQAARPLTRGSVFYPHDVLTTDASTSQAEIRFTDGTLVSLRPSTTLKVDDYQYAPSQAGGNKAELVKYAVGLVKGGFRSVSGAIAKENPNAYSINTPVATIGVRGTDFSIVIDNKGALAAKMYKGSISLKNSKGCVIIGAGGTKASGKAGQRTYGKDAQGCINVVQGLNVNYAFIPSEFAAPQMTTQKPSVFSKDPQIMLNALTNPNGVNVNGNTICIQ